MSSRWSVARAATKHGTGAVGIVEIVKTRTRLTRAAASIVVASAIALGTSSCVFINPIATLEEYDPSDGINATVGSVDLRNVILFFDEESGTGSLMVTFVNNGENRVGVSLGFVSGGEDVKVITPVGGGDVVEIGTVPGGEQLLIPQADTRLGALFPVYVQYGNNPGQQLLVPVLEGSGTYDGLGPASTN